jgi:hypothetical protein
MAGVAAGRGGAGCVTAAAFFTGSSSKFSFYIYFMSHILIDPIGENTGCQGKISRITEYFYAKNREFMPVFPGFERLHGMWPGFQFPNTGMER